MGRMENISEIKDSFELRTDLAVEEKESFPGDGGEVSGVSLKEWIQKKGRIKLTEVVIMDEKGALAMGKPVGTYLTLEASRLAEKDENYHREVSEELAKQLKLLIQEQELKKPKILVVGLGNRLATPDSLGPRVVDNLSMTRHLGKEYGEDFMREKGLLSVSGIVPGVMGQTGMESAEIVKGVVEETRPDLVIVVDALAARSVRRLGTTIQLTDTGIQPGSGVGNHRNAITEESVGVPVIAIGVPTVVDAATIVNDAMENLMKEMEHSETLKGVGVVLQGYHAAEKYELVRQLISPHLNGMFVTPKDVDETVKRISFTISEGLNLLFSAKESNGDSLAKQGEEQDSVKAKGKETKGQAHNPKKAGI